jgi:hypothetical protein
LRCSDCSAYQAIIWDGRIQDYGRCERYDIVKLGSEEPEACDEDRPVAGALTAGNTSLV